MTRPIDRPIFVIGMPRSGTTVLFEAFAARPDLAWLSQCHEHWPGIPACAVLSRLTDLTPAMRRSVGRSDQRRPWLERLRIGPVEAYEFWERYCGKKFRYDFLLDTEATAQEAASIRTRIATILRYQGKPRFAAKITGPGRIRYLSSIFPDARFVHVVRDGRAVVHSLLKAPFWQARSQNLEPAWQHGLDSTDVGDWRSHGSSLVALTAVQWRRVVESIRAEAAEVAADRYAETTYERFVSNPHGVLDRMALACDLPPSHHEHHFVDRRLNLRNMNYQWIEHFSPEEVATLTELLGRALTQLGYDRISPTAPLDGELLTRPFATASSDSAGRVV
ncbi:MAG: sulfotransferase family protein [Thermoanaerobaculia bacterium]